MEALFISSWIDSKQTYKRPCINSKSNALSLHDTIKCFSCSLSVTKIDNVFRVEQLFSVKRKRAAHGLQKQLSIVLWFESENVFVLGFEVWSHIVVVICFLCFAPFSLIGWSLLFFATKEVSKAWINTLDIGSVEFL